MCACESERERAMHVSKIMRESEIKIVFFQDQRQPTRKEFNRLNFNNLFQLILFDFQGWEFFSFSSRLRPTIANKTKNSLKCGQKLKQFLNCHFYNKQKSCCIETFFYKKENRPQWIFVFQVY